MANGKQQLEEQIRRGGHEKEEEEEELKRGKGGKEQVWRKVGELQAGGRSYDRQGAAGACGGARHPGTAAHSFDERFCFRKG